MSLSKNAPILLAAALAAWPDHVAAQSPQTSASHPSSGAPGDDSEGEEIIVNGIAPRGSVTGPIKPEQELNPADIRSYAVSSITDLLNELAPQTNAGGGTPVVLLNGKRISSFAEIQDLPTEAIARVQILPEEVSLKYGYAPDQKVVNIILRRRFRAVTAEARGGTSTDGGHENGALISNLLRIRGDDRFTLNAQFIAEGNIREDERDIAPTPSSRPYSLAGNITPPRGSGLSQIDPALSALAGVPVTIAGVPASAASGVPQLADFLAGANTPHIDDLGRYRTLSPSTNHLTINAVLARTLPGNISGSLNGRLDIYGNDALKGLPSASLLVPAGNPYSAFSNPVQLYRYLGDKPPLKQSFDTTTAHLGLTLNGTLSSWQWSFTGNYDYGTQNTRTVRGYDLTALTSAIAAGDPTVNPFGTYSPSLIGPQLVDHARSRTSALNGDLLFSGGLFSAPGGTATASLKLGANWNKISSHSLRAGTPSATGFSRTSEDGELSIDLPLNGRSQQPLGGIGELSLNGNAAAQHYSDFGTLSTLGYGVRWTPIPAIRLIASASQDRAAPSSQQLSGPQVLTPATPVFDYRTGQTVYISQLGGGNPNLLASNRHQYRLSLTLKPLEKTDLTITASYTRSRTSHPIASFPSPTPQVEAAFPDRFIRDPDGTLTQINTQAINFASARSSQLRWGFNFSKPIKSHLQKEIEAWRAAGAKPEGQPEELRALREAAQARAQQARERGDGQAENPGSRMRGGGGFGGGGFGGGGRGGGSGRLQFALYHTWHLTDDVVLTPGAPKLDLLDGGAIADAGGQPRHQLEGQAGYNNNGIGARVSVNWQSATRVDTGTASSLRFSDLTTVNLRIFSDLGQRPKLVLAHPFFRGARITFSINNLFNARQQVRDATGVTPLRYQPGYLDPVGRNVLISFRKLFL